MHIKPCKSHNNPMRLKLVFSSPFYRGGQWDNKKDMHIVSSGARTYVKAVWLWEMGF